MPNSTLQLIPLVPATQTTDLSVSTIDASTTPNLDLNEDENLCSFPSSDEPTPTSSSSSNCSPPSSSTSLDSLSSDSGEAVVAVVDDDDDDVVREEFSSCAKNELTLPENNLLSPEFSFVLTLVDETSPSTSPRPSLLLPPPPPQLEAQQEPQDSQQDTQQPPSPEIPVCMIIDHPNVEKFCATNEPTLPEHDSLPPAISSLTLDDEATSSTSLPLPSQQEIQQEIQQELQEELQKELQEIQQPPLPEIPLGCKKMIIDHSKGEKFCVNTCFGRPSRIGFFSSFSKANGERIYKEDKSSLRYLFIPADHTVGINLNEANLENLCGNQDDLFILNYISEHEYELIQKRVKDGDDDKENVPIADIICNSEVLTLLMVTPYKQKNWTLIGIKVRGAIILLKKESDEPANLKKAFERRKFLENITRRHDASKTHPDGDRDRFYSVSSVNVKNLRLLYSYPIDAAFNRRQSGPIDSYNIAQIEVRSANWDKDSKSKKNFWRNMGLNIWCSSLLGKSGSIIFGGKEPGGWVKHVDDPFLPADILKSSKVWSPKTCVDFMYQVLTHILTEQSPEELVPFEIRYEHHDDNPIGEIICTPLDEPAENFIPSWYIANESPDDYD